MEVVVAPAYRPIESFIRSIPQGDYPREQVWRNRRNTVELVRAGETLLVVKKYKRPTIANCIIYTWFRKNKAQKAWEHANLLLAKGFETARPIAYVVIKRYGFVHTCYFISEYLPYPTIDQAYAQCGNEEEKHRLVTAFIDYTIRLHNAKIVHRDYNPGNILVHCEADGYHFTLIDINRLKVGRVPSVGECMESLEMLGMNLQGMSDLLPLYAQRRGINEEEATNYLLRFRHFHRIRSYIKRKFKWLIGK